MKDTVKVVKDFVKVLSGGVARSVSFTKSEIRVIVFISIAVTAGFSVKYYKFLSEESVNTPYDFSHSDSVFREKSLKIYAGNKQENRQDIADENSVYKMLEASDDSVKRKEKLSADNEPPDFTVDLNTAGIEELTELPGVGESIAAKIISYRDANKRFKNINELMKVKGIGQKKFEKMKKYLKAD
ncbi:MAG: helix-hairpin-helix domain-containing protein [Ignavibacteria bacterium]|nr:helix-hairpin-helix domain-containing protein [Ignavibacteria bacterium]